MSDKRVTVGVFSAWSTLKLTVITAIWGSLHALNAYLDNYWMTGDTHAALYAAWKLGGIIVFMGSILLAGEMTQRVLDFIYNKTHTSKNHDVG